MGLELAAATLIAPGSAWRYWKGTSEASTPLEAWRIAGFDLGAWPAGPAPFHYGEAGLVGGTPLTDMRNRYTCVFLRQTFQVSEASRVATLTLRAACDDGFVAWLNGREIARYRVGSGALTIATLANSTAPEPVTWLEYAVTNFTGVLKEGANVMAVQVFNRSADSSDLQLDLALESTVADPRPPSIVELDPKPGIVGDLSQVTVKFSEAVQGVDEEDFALNAVPAEGVSGAADTYVFWFRNPGPGVIELTLATGHGIADLATPPNLLDTGETGVRWVYEVRDDVPPRLAAVHPPAGRTLRGFTEVDVWFTEPMEGVVSSALEANGQPARQVRGIGAGPYTFTFVPDPVAPGSVQLRWAAGHGITDRANPPNALLGSDWAYAVDPTADRPDVVVSEFCAANVAATGLKDEDGETEDWIELWNRGERSVDLEGWALTDDPDRHGKWVFPQVRLEPGAYLVVFASGKDRRSTAAGARLHTNFKLADDGEYLGLWNAELPREVVHEFGPAYPNQRNDHSYGWVSAGAGAGTWRHFAAPTPGRANGPSELESVLEPVRFVPPRGRFETRFDLVLTQATAGVTIRYTTDGSEPTATTGLLYTGPIRVDTTRVIRAAAFQTGRLPSRVDTHTYLFPEAVLRQPTQPTGFSTSWGSSVVIPGDYAMDPRVVDHPTYAAEVRAGLRQLPVLSLVMPESDWFSPNRGIYSNGQREGLAWERRVSAEWLEPDGKDGFQVNAGVRVQGGTSPSPWRSQKLSLRLNFRGDYGPTRLEYALYGDSPVRRFDTLVLDAGYNYTWHYAGGSSPDVQRTRAKHVQDQFVSDLQNRTGTPSFHGRWAHLYLNGLYWGLYNVHEDPEAAFGADYFGGDKEEYDVLKHTGGSVVDGDGAAWTRLMQLARAGLGTSQSYLALQELLDVPALIDYLLIHLYVGNTDWPHHNWYALRRRTPGAQWRFISWDSEHVMKSVNEDRLGVNDADSPAELYALLRQNPEFRLHFADRAHRHFFNGGMLAVDPQFPAWDPARPERNQPAAIYHQRVTEIFTPLVCESARWGDNQRPNSPFLRDAEWLTELNWLRNTYFPQRSATVLSQLRTAGLYPNLAAPTFSQHGGYVAAGFALTLSAPAGTVYYTLDGSDPRGAFSGAVSPRAVIARAGSPIVLTQSTEVKARALHQGVWSALNETVFHVAQLVSPLRVTELMYHPPGGDAYEFIELANTGPVPLDVSGLRLDGLGFTFPPFSVLRGGEVIVLSAELDPVAFAARYPGVRVWGTFGGSLSNGGERLRALFPGGSVLWTLEYGDASPWPAEADGAGASLEVIDFAADPSDPANWRPSAALGGSPGQHAPTSPVPGVILAEVYACGNPAASDEPLQVDWIELHNAGSTDVLLAGWSLSDNENPRRFVVPPGTLLPAGGRWVVRCGGTAGSNPPCTDFGLDHEGETVGLYDASTSRVDAITFGLQAPGYSLGRLAEAEGGWGLTQPTWGRPNLAAFAASPTNLILNEWLANPLPGDEDWVELHNQNREAPVALRGLHFRTGDRLARLMAWAFLPPQQQMRLWADERPGVDHLTLRLPATGTTLELLDAVGRPLDRVTYAAQREDVSEGRLPDGAPRIGPLQALTPGRPNQDDPTQSDRDADGLPDVWETTHGLDPRSGRGADGPDGDPDQDGQTNADEWLAGTSPQDPTSRFAITELRTTATDVLVKFEAAPHRRYRLETRSAWDATPWEILAELEAGTEGGPRELVEPRLDPGRTRFFRLVLLPGL